MRSMKTYEEAGVATVKLDNVISQLLSREAPCASREFVHALLIHARDHGSKLVTRKQLAGLVNRDAEAAGSNNWAKDVSVQRYLEARREFLSQALDVGAELDWECQSTKPVYWRTGIRDTRTDNAFRLEGSVVRYREHLPSIGLSWRGRLRFPEVGSPAKAYQPWMFAIPLMIAAAILVLLGFYPAIVILSGKPSTLASIFSLIMVFVFMAVICLWIKRWYGTLIDDRIVLISSANVIGDFEGASLEFDYRSAKPSVQLHRYVSDCPICNGKVRLSDGGSSYPARLVGRCVDSPREHVYSFDRVTLEGSPLVARVASGLSNDERRYLQDARDPAG